MKKSRYPRLKWVSVSLNKN